jgi:hypothetical protein
MLFFIRIQSIDATSSSTRVISLNIPTIQLESTINMNHVSKLTKFISPSSSSSTTTNNQSSNNQTINNQSTTFLLKMNRFDCNINTFNIDDDSSIHFTSKGIDLIASQNYLSMVIIVYLVCCN